MMSGQPWDTHSNNSATLRSLCKSTDGPVSALLMDLKQRGLLAEQVLGPLALRDVADEGDVAVARMLLRDEDLHRVVEHDDLADVVDA